jgi:release factor glutamine methyltransferase
MTAPFRQLTPPTVLLPDLATQPSLGDLVGEFTERFAQSGIERPREVARDLVGAILDRPRFWASLHPDERPPRDDVEAMREAATRRAAGAPFAYAVRRAAFRFLTLRVDERVLIPRPETEQLVDLVLAADAVRLGGGTVIDVGTGSGAIALALAAEARFHRVIATDLSADAIQVARENAADLAASLRAPVAFALGAGITPVRHVRARVVVSNPPYIAFPELSQLPRLVRDWEPVQALCCAEDGLAVTRDIVAGAAMVLEPGGLLALETDSRRAVDVARMIEASRVFTAVAVRRDLAGRDRFVLATYAGQVLPSHRPVPS